MLPLHVLLAFLARYYEEVVELRSVAERVRDLKALNNKRYSKRDFFDFLVRLILSSSQQEMIPALRDMTVLINYISVQDAILLHTASQPA